MRNSYLLGITLLSAAAWGQPVTAISREVLSVNVSDDSGNLVGFFVTDARFASGDPMFSIQIFGFGPDVGDLACQGDTFSGSPIADPVDVVASARRASAAFTSDGLTDFSGAACRSDIAVVATCSAGTDAFKHVCFDRSENERVHQNEWQTTADCNVQITVGDLVLSDSGEGNGGLQFLHFLTNL